MALSKTKEKVLLELQLAKPVRDAIGRQSKEIVFKRVEDQIESSKAVESA